MPSATRCWPATADHALRARHAAKTDRPLVDLEAARAGPGRRGLVVRRTGSAAPAGRTPSTTCECPSMALYRLAALLQRLGDEGSFPEILTAPATVEAA
ncbi:MAG: hypothetical protein R2734_00950 [Nocardioides sp.]